MRRIKEIFVWFKSLFSSSKKESWRVVLLCLLAGTTFWVLNALNKNYTTKINYPIDFLIENPEEIVVVDELPEKIEIDVTGGGWNLLRKTYWFNINPVKIPLSNPAEVNYILGSSLVPLISDQLSEVSLNYVVTDTLFVDIEEKATKVSSVSVDSQSLRLKPPFRLVSNIRINPDSVVFTGPESLINEIPDTIYLHLPEEIAANFDEEVPINYSSSELISYTPEAVNVTFDVAPFVRETIVVDVQPLNFPADSSILLLDDKVEVIFTIQEDKLATIDEESFQIIANFKNMEKEDSIITATLGRSPEAIHDLKVNPKKLRIRKADR